MAAVQRKTEDKAEAEVKDQAPPEPRGDAEPGTNPPPAVPERFNPRAAAELPPGMPQGYDPGATRKPYRVLASFVLDDDGYEVPQGGKAELSDSLAKRYTSDRLTGGYGEGNSRALIEPWPEDDGKDEE